VTRADATVDRIANWFQKQADEAAGQGGVAAKLAQPLADDAAFLRKLKPSLIKLRARGEAPTNQKPAEGTTAPTMPQLGERPKPTGNGGGGPNPLLIVGAAFAAGVVIAKLIDWRGHAHPR
jgi:hypothetical protein